MTEIIDGIPQPENVSEKLVKATWFETAGSGTTSGTVTKPAGNGTDVSFVLDEWGTDTDALVSKMANGKPTWETPVDAGGNNISTTFNTAGEYSFSGTPSPAGDHAVIFVYTCYLKNFNSDESIFESELVPAQPGSDHNIADHADTSITGTNLDDWLDQAVKVASSPTFAGVTLGNTGLHILDTNASHDLIIKPGSDLTADRTFTITTGDAARTLTLLENLTLANGNDGILEFVNASKAIRVEDSNLMPYTGWPLSPGVTLSFVDGTRTFTVTDGGSAFYYVKGVRYILGGNKTVVIDDTEGEWYIYFVGTTLTASQVMWDIAANDVAHVSILYWDATNNKQIILGYELHDYLMAGSTHERLHSGGGAVFNTGLGVSDAGSEDINIAAGEFHDEDIDIIITDGVGGGLFEQVLSPAEYPIYHLDGASNWRVLETTDKKTATDIGYIDGSNDLKYNKLNGTWALATAGNNNYMAMWIIATNDLEEPIAAIIGQRVDNTLTQSERNNVLTDLVLTGMPFTEIIFLARVIIRDTNSGVYYTLEDITDLRSENAEGNASSPVTGDHGALAGLGDDDHGQYILVDGSRDPTGANASQIIQQQVFS